MPAIIPPIDRREQGRLFGTVVADAFDDHEERQAGDQQGNAAMGRPPWPAAAGPAHGWSRARVEVRAAWRGLATPRDAASTVGQAH